MGSLFVKLSKKYGISVPFFRIFYEIEGRKDAFASRFAGGGFAASVASLTLGINFYMTASRAGGMCSFSGETKTSSS